MAIHKKFQKKKYKLMADVMRQLRFTDEQIENKLIEYGDLNGWEPITFVELISMSQKEKDKLKSYCWHEGIPRCETIGIFDVVFHDYTTYFKLTYSDNNGDPYIHFGLDGMNNKIDNVGDGTWNYGLYKKVK
jgi:hypothetical protein